MALAEGLARYQYQHQPSKYSLFYWNVCTALLCAAEPGNALRPLLLAKSFCSCTILVQIWALEHVHDVRCVFLCHEHWPDKRACLDSNSMLTTLLLSSNRIAAEGCIAFARARESSTYSRLRHARNEAHTYLLSRIITIDVLFGPNKKDMCVEPELVLFCGSSCHPIRWHVY